MVAAGAGSSITGLRAELLVSHDLVSGAEQADRPGQLGKPWQWYLSDARTRMKPRAIEIMIMTRWSQRDPAGHIVSMVEPGEEDWRVIRSPMLAGDDDPIGREPGEPLWPEWFTDRQLTAAQRDPRRWSCLYQQRPLDERGAWVSDDHIEFIDALPNLGDIVVGIDIALGMSKGDYSATATRKHATRRCAACSSVPE